MKMVGSTLEHLDGGVGLGSLNDRDQIADQFGSYKVRGRRCNFYEQNGAFLAHAERLKTTESPRLSLLISFDIFHSPNKVMDLRSAPDDCRVAERRLLIR